MRHRFYALGRKRSGEMNKTEAAYERVLRARQQAGEIEWYQFEGMTFRLAKKTRYTPDFTVMLNNGEFQCHEVKGFMMDDANVKIKCAAEMYPIRFFVVRLVRKQWEITEV